jgi:hypothetical protein
MVIDCGEIMKKPNIQKELFRRRKIQTFRRYLDGAFTYYIALHKREAGFWR